MRIPNHSLSCILILALSLLSSPIRAQILPPPTTVTLSAAEAQQQALEIEESVPIATHEDFEVSLWASEALVGDPVSIDMDDEGRAHIGATVRRRSSMFDIRNFPQWVDESWSWTTVQERIDFLHRELAPENSGQNEWLKDMNEDGSHDWRDLTVEDEKVYLIEDTNSDGRADRSQLYRWGFDKPETDIVGTVLYHQGDTYVGVAPNLWRAQDTNDDGIPDTKESISYGYGIHIGLGGHGVSGLKIGPDGRLYWGIGDVGFSGVDKDGQRWSFPKQGILARSELDGTGFEIYAFGLRNVHEFDWDEYGNIIGVDNDGDHAGEHERIVYLINGSDTGWRNNWQLGKYNAPKNNDYKIWMDEGYYKVRFPEQTALILPAIAPYHSGPAGMVFNPGAALSEDWRQHFFVASFTGAAANSRIDAFTLVPAGASFELGEKQKILSGITSVGIDFGPEGALYLADWKEGWDTDAIGRIWKLDTPDAKNSPVRRETQGLLADSFSDRSVQNLKKLLEHLDRRVRLKAQFELAGRHESEAFENVIKHSNHQLARIHGIWGLGQLGRLDAEAVSPLVELIEDEDPEIRAQAARTLGDVRYQPSAERITALLQDPSLRVRLLATEALGRLAHRPAFEPIVRMLAENDDRDAYLRHAGAVALARLKDEEALSALSEHASRGVRIAAVVALDRLASPSLAAFLQDSDEFVVTNAARAINDDEHVTEAIPTLARLLGVTPFTNEPLLRRAINANLYSGRAEDAQRLSLFALRTDIAAPLRVEAINTLSTWSDASIYDRVSGWTRGELSNDLEDAQTALALTLEKLLADRSIAVRIASVNAVGSLKLEKAADLLYSIFQNEAAPEVRVATLQALRDVDYDNIEQAVGLALTDEAAIVRQSALSLIPQLDLEPSATVALLSTVLEAGTVAEKQVALNVLAELSSEETDTALDAQLDLFEAGRLDAEVELELIQAIERSASSALQNRLRDLLASRSTDDPISGFQAALRGGDVTKGRDIFYNAPAAQCIRCHSINGDGGDVGPDLSSIGKRLDRRQILRSLVDPSADIAPGFGVVSVTTNSGETFAGFVERETSASLTLRTQGQEPRTFRKKDIAQRFNAPSSMPPMGVLLNRNELRDLVEFLSSLTTISEFAKPAPSGGHGGI